MLSKSRFTQTVLALFLLVVTLTFFYPLPPLLGASSGWWADQGASGGWVTNDQSAGVVWKTKKFERAPFGKQLVNVLEFDPKVAALRSVKTRYSDKYESISSMGNRTNALAGINGGFFCHNNDDICAGGNPEKKIQKPCPPGIRSSSLLIISGEEDSPNCRLRTSLGITKMGVPKIKAIDENQGWSGIEYAIGAGPNLVTRKRKDVSAEGFYWYDDRHPRTAVAITSEGHLLMVTVDGRRREEAEGMTIDELATFLINEFHVTSAMNFDGGGSTTMFFRGRVVNMPSDATGERGVYDGLFAYPK